MLFHRRTSPRSLVLIDFEAAFWLSILQNVAVQEITAVATARRVKEEADKERKQAQMQIENTAISMTPTSRLSSQNLVLHFFADLVSIREVTCHQSYNWKVRIH